MSDEEQGLGTVGLPEPAPFADLIAAVADRETREQEATRREAMEQDEHHAPVGEQNTAAWVEKHGAAYIEFHGDVDSTMQVAVRDDLLVGLAPDGRVVGVARRGWLVMAADLAEVLAWLRVSGRQFYRTTPAEVPSAE